jgi:hypothetical protein
MRKTNQMRGEVELAAVALVAMLILIILAGGMFGCPHYGVYSQRLEGEAELAKAEYSKKVAVQEAQAKKDSAKMLAEAEVERAKGVAQANAIIAESLKGNEAYLRYLWIQTLEHGNNEVIYVPTEANLPVLEAQRLAPKPRVEPVP